MKIITNFFNQDMQRIDVLVQVEKGQSMDEYREMLRDCMGDYDDRGWTNSWRNLD